MKQVTKNKSEIYTIGNSQTGHYYWIGNGTDGIDHFVGQTFKTGREGKLQTISIYPEMIFGQTDAVLSVFEFDEKLHTWKEKKSECRLMLNKEMAQKWISFDMKQIHLYPERQYAFKVNCNHGGMMAIAECSWKFNDPYPDGEQWVGSSENPAGNFHRNFDIAFIAEIKTN